MFARHQWIDGHHYFRNRWKKMQTHKIVNTRIGRQASLVGKVFGADTVLVHSRRASWTQPTWFSPPRVDQEMDISIYLERHATPEPVESVEDRADNFGWVRNTLTGVIIDADPYIPDVYVMHGSISSAHYTFGIPVCMDWMRSSFT